jgi:hypothetical protein
MSTTTTADPTNPNRTTQEMRVLNEGYGPGAWHGPDLKSALDGVPPELALWRPAAGRHNIAEIALHHAYYARAVRAQISGQDAEPFVVDGEDWFQVTEDGPLPGRPSTRRSSPSSRSSPSCSRTWRPARGCRRCLRASASLSCSGSPATPSTTRDKCS